jgi:hypothetical protein
MRMFGAGIAIGAIMVHLAFPTEVICVVLFLAIVAGGRRD